MSDTFIFGPIPQDWQTKTIGELAVHVGSGITPTGGSDVYTDTGVTFIRSQNVTNEGLLLDDVAFIDQKTHDRMKASEVFPFDVLLNITGASIGRCCYLPSGLGPTNVNQHVCAIRLPAPSYLDAKYLASVLASPIGQSQIFRLNAGGNREGLNYQQLRVFGVPWPRRKYRAGIARILTTLDNLIEKTEALIAKYQAIKQGMMHDLFTRGVDAHGHLRPPQAEASDLYKQSELGWIPKEWNIGRVGDHLDRIEQGWSPDCDSEPASAGEWGVLKTTAVVWDGFDSKENKRLPRQLSPMGQFEVHLDDVLMTRGGPNSRVGVVAIVRETQEKIMLSDKIYRLVPRKTLSAGYLALALSSERTQTHLSTLKTGLAESQTNISQAIVRRLWIGLPGEEEQERACKKFDAVTKAISSEIRLLSEYRVQKNGLIQDLLTGKVRVKVDEAEMGVLHV